MIVFATAITDLDVYERAPPPGVHRLREDDPDDRADRLRQRRLDLSQLQPDHRPGQGPRRRRGAGPDPPGRRDPGPRVSSTKLRAGARRPRGRDRRLRRRRRRPQHRLVGGLDHLGLVHPPLRRARRRRDPGLLVGDRDAAAVRAARRGRLDRRLRHGRSRRGRCDNLRFDESLGQMHGYDFDICMQARAAGKKVVTADLQVVHHHSLRLIDDPESWIKAYMRLAEKWDEQLPHNGSARSRLGVARAPGRGRGVGGAADGRGRGAAPGRPLQAARGAAEQLELADHRAAAPAAPAPGPAPLRARRAPRGPARG